MSPLFDGIPYLHKNHENVSLSHPALHQTDFLHGLAFLKSYTGSLGTFTSYRREIERLLQWTWHVKKTTLPALKRVDIEAFISFSKHPPASWIGTKKVPRFIENTGRRIPNTAWRPFVVTVPKAIFKEGKKPQKEDFSLSEGAVQEIFAILSTFFNFLLAEEYLSANPVALIRQKSKFIRKRQGMSPVRRLSAIQWEAVFSATKTLAEKDPQKHERTLFILSLLLGMYLRISELAASPRWVPLMRHFFKDSHGNWWFITVGKGNKERQIAVSDTLLQSLIRFRRFLGLSDLPSMADTSPLLSKIRGKGPLSDTAQIRRLVQLCFDAGKELLLAAKEEEEAQALDYATVHWLRHTGISEDVKIRPREHVRDDAGHSSSATTDRYIDVERLARHRTARKKSLQLSLENVEESS